MRKQTAVLIIDEFQSVRDVLRLALERRGYDVFVAASCEGALDMLERRDLDAVIVDSRTPGMATKTFIHILTSKWPSLISRTIVMIADPVADGTQQWLKEFELPVVFKPFLPSELCELVDRVTANRPTNSSAAD